MYFARKIRCYFRNIYAPKKKKKMKNRDPTAQIRSLWGTGYYVSNHLQLQLWVTIDFVALPGMCACI
jgi:hypothetical protein